MRNGEITAFFACLSKLPGPRRSRRCSVPQGGLSFPHPTPAIKNLNFVTFPCLQQFCTGLRKEKANQKTLAQSPDVGSI